MPAALYLRPSPRAFFLLTETHALIFRQPTSSESKASKSVVVAEFLPIEEVDSRGLIGVGRAVEGVLGVTSVPSDRSPIPEIFLILISHSTLLPPLLPSSDLRPSKVLGVDFYSLTSNFWDSPDLISSSQSHSQSGYSTFSSDGAYGYDDDDPASSGHAPITSSSSMLSQAQQQGLENPCNGMKKYLESGGFFFAEETKWDISSRMGDANWVLAEKALISHPLETFDDRFVWNSSLLAPFLAFRNGLSEDTKNQLDAQALIIPIIQGFCGSLPISTGNFNASGKPESASLGLISRLSWKRAGARFRTRGIDDDGQVANFVETELVLATESVVMSYVQVRGSVPLFWQQPSAGLGTLQQKVELTRPPQATQPAFDKHFLELLEHYHSVHAINLLGQKDAESMLSLAYSDHLKSLRRTLDSTPIEKQQSTSSNDAGFNGRGASERGKLDLTPYDFHSAVKTGGHEMVKYDFSMRLNGVVDSMDDFGWTAIDKNGGMVVEKQDGVFRTNCLDCLDRTNYVQDVISSLTLSRFLSSIGSPLGSSQSLWAAHRELWADNGDRLSKIYAGTGALNTSATRSGKKTFAGLLSDATKSVSRAYINNFQDKGKQDAIDMLLGMMAGQRPVILFDPISDSVQAALGARVNEYSKTRTISIFSGTWNLNGKAPDEALDAWLFPPNAPEADVYMIAFQEIVELTAGQILQTDPAKKRVWEKFIMDTFAMRKANGGKSDYLLFRSEQLVGSALIIIVKTSLSKHIRGVESTTKKTGLSGLSGNKGGVGIRFQLFDSNICFVTSHLTAGHSNLAERNSDWRVLTNGMKFLRGKMVEDHDFVIWSADLNYRIALSNADVREAAEAGKLDLLLAADQLSNAMDAGETFVGYDEGPIRFRPTYKYDNGSEDYDTSEKQRIPAWTDRVLFRGSALRLKEYNRAELMTSDHRPVYAIFDATIREVDHARKETISKEIVHNLLSSGNRHGRGVDGEVESLLAGNGGVGDIVKGLTRVSVTPSLPASRSPRLPPRPSSAASMKETTTSTPITTTASGRMHSQSLSNGSTTSATSSLRALASSSSGSSRSHSSLRPPSDNQYPNQSSSQRRAAPPVPSRPNLSPALSPNMQTSPIIPLSPDRKPSLSPLPRSLSSTKVTPSGTESSTTTSPASTGNGNGSWNSNRDRDLVGSSAITPTSTGDYVVVPSPSSTSTFTKRSASIVTTGSGRQAPPLPPRAIPTPKSSIDQIQSSRPAGQNGLKAGFGAGLLNDNTSAHSNGLGNGASLSSPSPEDQEEEMVKPSLAALRSKFEQPQAASGFGPHSVTNSRTITKPQSSTASAATISPAASNVPSTTQTPTSAAPTIPPKPKQVSSDTAKLPIPASASSLEKEKSLNGGRPVVPKKPVGLKAGEQ